MHSLDCLQSNFVTDEFLQKRNKLKMKEKEKVRGKQRNIEWGGRDGGMEGEREEKEKCIRFRPGRSSMLRPTDTSQVHGRGNPNMDKGTRP